MLRYGLTLKNGTELQDASATLPKCMILSTIINGALGWITVITLCFCLGDLDAALATPTGYPFIEVFYNAIGSIPATTAMAAIILFLTTSSCFTNLANASRQLYAFSRDRALPFSPWLSKVVYDIPVNAIFVTFFFTIILSLINIGSAAALNIISSLGTAALLSSYIGSIGCMVWRRVSGNPLPKSKFSLGKWGLPINIVSLALLILFFVLAFFPSAPNPDIASMNWSILVYGAVILFCMVYFYFRGRHRYVGPVEYVMKLD